MSNELSEALSNLEKAKNAYEDASQAYRHASTEQTACLNRLNNAQKAFDKAADAVRGDHPRDSGWSRRKYEQVCEA